MDKISDKLHLRRIKDSLLMIALQWLQKGTYQYADREVLECIKITENYMIVADGFQLRAIKTPDQLKDLVGKNIKITWITDGGAIEFQEMEDKFPDVSEIINMEDPVFEFQLNGAWLYEILRLSTQDPTNQSIRLKFYDETKPVEIFFADNAYAVLMPEHFVKEDDALSRTDDFNTWKPDIPPRKEK